MKTIESKSGEKEIYFVLLTEKEEEKDKIEKTELNFISKIVPENIIVKEIKLENRTILEAKVFKFNVKDEDKDEISEEEIAYKIEYIIGDDIYTISFNTNKNTFIFDVALDKRDQFINILYPTKIDQDRIPLYSKLELFLEALKIENQENKIEKLYEESILLYEKKKQFNLLVFLFYNIYEKENLCSKLLETFGKIKGIENPNSDKNIDKYLEEFNKIFLKDEFKGKEKNKQRNFYGIILCYLYYYDKKDSYFSKNINKLYKENDTVLYDILIMFSSYFLKPLNQDFDFYEKFIEHVINDKDSKNFEKAISYINDIEIYVSIINYFKNEIYEKYKDIGPIKIKPELKLTKKRGIEAKKNELSTIKDLIEKIIAESKTKEHLLVYFPSKFWKYLLQQYDESNKENISKCYELRELFKEYYKLIKELYIDRKDNRKSKEEKKEDKLKEKIHKNKENRSKDKKDKNKDKEEKKANKLDDKKENKKDNKKDIDKDIIKNDIEIYYKRDEFTFVLNRNIKDFLSENNLSNQKKLALINQYNPYFNNKDEDDKKKFNRNRDVSIFDCVDFNNIDQAFISDFHSLDLESLFKANILEFLKKIVSKIQNIENFGNVLELIDIKRIEDKAKDFYDLLKNKYDELIKNEIELIKEEKELNRAIEILCKFISRIFLFEKNCDFLDNKISLLDNSIKSLIYEQLLKTYNTKAYEKMRDYIFKIFLKTLDVEIIIKLLDSLTEPEERNKILEEIVKKCKFTKVEFYSNRDNKHIKVLCDLNKKEKFKEFDVDCCKDFINTLDDIYKDLESNLFTKSILEEFLGEEKNKDIVIEKLRLIKIVINGYDPKDKYEKLSNKIKNMNDQIKELNNIKNSLSIFHYIKFKEEINNIANKITEIEAKPINEYDTQNMQESIKELTKNKTLCLEVNHYKNLLIFQIIFDNATGLGLDQEKRFIRAKEKLLEIKEKFKNDKISIEVIFKEDEKIFSKIKDELSKKEEKKSKEFIEQMINYFKINEKNKEDFEIILKSKKYEIDVKSIKYFFDIFDSNILKFPNNLDLSKMSLKNLRNTLESLEKSKIYNYKNDENYYKIFISFYQKKQAIDFLKEKINNGIKLDYLEERLDPTKRRLTIEQIKDTIKCLETLKELQKNKGTDMLKYITKLDEETIKKFISYSKIYQAIIELDRNDENDDEDEGNENTFKKVDKRITKANFIFKPDNNDFYYTEKDKNIETHLEDLIHIKNQISIQSKKNDNNTKGDKTKDINEKLNKDPFEIKCDKLLFFKKLVYSLENIYEKVNDLRIKGCNLPIVISIKVEYPIIEYKLNQIETDYGEIRHFLLKAKKNYDSLLNKRYINDKYLRFLYGRIFRKIKIHLDSNCQIEEIQRYILNITNYNEKIIEGKIYNEDCPKDYVNYTQKCNEKIFENISNYITSLFQNNENKDWETHYNKLLIRDKEGKEKEKGIYLKKCQDKSKEETILYLFWDKLEQKPIAQNLLICSKETSIEEIQSFFSRAVLCDKNTLFVCEITESFTDFQYNKIYTYLDELLSIKFEKNKNQSKCNDKLKAREYLDSCIVFVYDNDLKNNLKEIEKYIFDKDDKVNSSFMINKDRKKTNIYTSLKKPMNQINNITDISVDKNNSNPSNDTLDISLNSIQNNPQFIEEFKNIKIFSSDVCGLGKSYKIKKLINDEKRKKKYYHFPLGGELTKRIIYEKIKELFSKIKSDEKIQIEEKTKDDIMKRKKIKKESLIIDYSTIAIHIDLAESKEVSLISEFLFSFLITKFYTYNEDIIYIPDNLNIYIEIPNCFQNYLTQIGILNAKVFKIENISCGKKKESLKSNIQNIEMDKLELDKETRDILKKMIGLDKDEKNEKIIDEKIEQFVKQNLGVENYSYYQVNTFIKLFISQCSKLKGNKVKFQFRDSNYKDITEKCIKDFSETSKYFTYSGFARLLMENNENSIKDKFDLCLDAYKSDLNNSEFKAPIFYVDEKTQKHQLIYINENIDEEKEKEEELRKKKKIKKNVDIVYLMDATGSMGKEIDAAKEKVKNILDELNKKFKDLNLSFKFGAVFYRDQIDSKEDKNECFPLTDNMDELKNFISTIRPYGGGDVPEDWVEGYNLALNKIEWRDGLKLIIHIADAGAHGEEFSKGDKYSNQGPLLCDKIKECVEKNINIIGFKITQTPEQSFEKMKEVYEEHRLHVKNNGQFIDVYNFNRERVLEDFYNLVLEATNEVVNPSYKYLKKLKKILNLNNEVENNENRSSDKSLLSLVDILKKDSDNYVITNDNFKKMIFLLYRIQANLPVIIMGETGCGKTSLIKKLNQLLNNGKNLVYIIKIHPGIKDKDICESMSIANEKATRQELIDEKSKKKKELWVFFDEINTSPSLSLLTEIFINRTFKGKKLEDNIRLIGACNPYRKKVVGTENVGLENEDINDEQACLEYKVHQLPQSLLYYVYSFGSINDEDEKKYIYSIINPLFNSQEQELLELTTEAISECHKFLRDIFKSPSVVSLREITRFTKCVEFFKEYFLNKNNEKKNDISYEKTRVYLIKSIICSIYLCYYIRLNNGMQRGNFDHQLYETLLDLANVYSENNIDEDDGKDFINNITYKPLYEDLRDQNINNFREFLEKEEDFLLEQMDLDKGIGKNQLLKENVFLSFLSVCTKIPLIIVGKPGTGKSLSSNLIISSMKGEYSLKPFFKKYPQIIQIYFQGSKSNIPEEVEKLFSKAEKLYNNFKKNNPNKKGNEIPIYMILFDELGLAERSPFNPLKVLHHKLEYDGKTEGVCFVGISNYSLDAAKVNRALYLAVPNLEDYPDEICKTAESIVDNISPELNVKKDRNNMLIFDIISRAYCDYKKFLINLKKIKVLKQYFIKKGESKIKKTLNEIENDELYKYLYNIEEKMKTDFHGNRDFYSIIKSVSIDGSKLTNINNEKESVGIIENYIERNFGGINYGIDVNFDFEIENKEQIVKDIMQILGDKFKNKQKKNNKKSEENIIEINSVYIFKKIYNKICEEKAKNLKIQNIQENYDLNKRMNENINDRNSRYLLLEIETNISSLIVENIKMQNPEKKNNIQFLNGSTFPDDNNNDYRFQKISEIQDYAAQPGKILILQNLNDIQPYLYDLYNMNYKMIDEQKFVRICLDNLNEQDTPVSDSFRIIILVDKKFVDTVDMAFLNRLEKMQIKFDNLLNDEQNLEVTNILKTIELKESIKKKKLNYDLNNLLINSNREEIGGMVYNAFIEAKNEKLNLRDIREKIFTKISNIIPQDIVVILKNDNVIKRKYYEKKYYNFLTYIKDLEAKIINYKISIIYTFSDIASPIIGCNKDKEIMISKIRSENQLKNTIDEMKNIEYNENIEEQNDGIIVIHFEQKNSDKIQFVSDYIINYLQNDKDKTKNNYIFLVHIFRKFSGNQNGKERIYSIPNINNDINQIFIDNLNGPSGLTLKNIGTKDIKSIMFESGSSMDEEGEFKKSLLNFVYNGIKEKNKTRFLDGTNEDDYYNELLKYMENNKDFKQNLIKRAKELIVEDKNAKGDCGTLIDKMLNDNYINKNCVDLISCIMDYIKDNIFNKNLEKIFTILEHYNFLTTLIEIDKDRDIKIDEDIIKEIENKILSDVKIEESQLQPKFLFGYKIPGFFNFYKNLSELINKNFSTKYLENEKDIREYMGNNIDSRLYQFHDNEESILNELLDEIKKDKDKFEFFLNLLNRMPHYSDLILNDYITFYLDKYIEKEVYFKSCKNIIKLLLNLRFSSERNQIIENNETQPINILFIKILWIVSNTNYIKNIIKLFDLAKNILNYDQEGNIIYEMTENIINNKENSIRYIVNPTRNPEHTREVNECFYIILASLCLSITSKDIKLTDSKDDSENFKNNEINIMNYYDQLKKINIILQKLNNELFIYLNELYIIDELFKVIDYKELSIKAISKIRDNLRESALNIQNDKKNYLVDNLKCVYTILKEEKKTNKNEDKFYDMLKYIFMKEIKKVNDINYRVSILDIIIKEKEIIKKSNDILQIFLKSYFKAFKHTLKNLLDGKGKDIMVELLDRNLSDEKQEHFFTLSETLLYFFEKNSLIYLKENDKTLEKEPTDIFKDCFKYLNEDFLTSEKYYNKSIHIAKIFCLGYIKAFCYIFVKMHNKSKFDPKKIIEVIDKYNKDNIVKMIVLYIYKIIYNKNNRQIDIFLKHDIKEKYKLSKYKNFKKFIKFKDEEKLNYGIEALDNDNYKNIFDILLKYKNDEYKKRIEEKDIDDIINSEGDNDNKLKFDNFYLVAYNLVLSGLNKKDFSEEIYTNFYTNICEPLFQKNSENEKLFELIQFVFNPKKFNEIKSAYNIDEKDIDVIFYGFRYCINELAEEYSQGEYIYSSLYNKSNINYLKEKLYPGSDTNEEPLYELYNRIENHFKQKPKEGCYVCLCNKGYYHSIPAGFPGSSEKNLKCPYCGEDIGSKEKIIEEKDEIDEKVKKIITYEPIEREKYFRIFDDEEEIETLKRNKDKKNMLSKIKYKTREQFKQEFIEPLYSQEKGLNKIDENKFKNNNKIIRNLSQISYRLLNYILYSHLFFAKLITKENDFDKYLPEGMTWFNTIKECFVLLRNELNKNGIKKIEIFMNVVFSELFNKLHDKECINEYNDLIDFEDDLEKIIQENIEKTKNSMDKLEEIEKENCNDKKSALALLKELYNKNDYDKKEYPYYEYFYYSDYPDESYIEDLLEHEDKTKYSILIQYLEYKNHSIKENELYSPNNLILFNKVLNLINEEYSHNITREKAENQRINNIGLYQKNPELINKFIELYNKFECKYKDLNIDKNYLCDFVLDENNKYGKTYKKIYKEFTEQQNEKLKTLDIKSKQGKFNSNCLMKINIQKIKEEEIFSYKIFKKLNFYEVMFNSSYRKIIDTSKYENYNDFVIVLDTLEEEMTDLLLGNKKLLKDDELNEFKYKNEEFLNQINDLITNFESKYNIQDIDDSDKIVIYNFILTHNGNNDEYKKIINDFVSLIEFLYKIKIDENSKIKIDENTKIYEVFNFLKGVSKNFENMFKEKEGLIVKKITKLYDYYLKLIFKYVKKDIENYQENPEKKVIEEKNKIKEKKEEKKEEKEKKIIFNLEDKTIKKLDEYFTKEDLTISKESLSEALRLFMTIVLYREKDKENKIKLNKNNIVGYLKEQDLWINNNIKIDDDNFKDNLSKIKSIHIKIKEILWLYYYLTDKKDENFENDIKEKYLEDLKAEEKKKNKGKELKSDNENDDDDNKSESERKSQKSKSSSKNSSRSCSKSSSRSNSRSSSSNSKKSSKKSSRKSSINSAKSSDGDNSKDADDRD